VSVSNIAIGTIGDDTRPAQQLLDDVTVVFLSGLF
jgi:hypothetical protein